MTTGPRRLYATVDVSWSMCVDGRLVMANDIVRSLVDAAAHHSELTDGVQFGLVEFSDDARIRVPLGDPRAIGRPPELTPRSGTNFTAVFDLLRYEIGRDATRWPAGAGPANRPVILFISDGGPTDDEPTWRAAFASLVTSHTFPVVLPCSLTHADLDRMAMLIHPTEGPERTALYAVEPDARPAGAVHAITDAVLATLIRPDRPAVYTSRDGVVCYYAEHFA